MKESRIENFPDYAIREDGVVISYRMRKPRVLKQVSMKGYFIVELRQPENGDFIKRQTQLVHRLVAKAFIPNPDNKPCVNHINGIKTDNCAVNLEWVTAKENNQHAFDTGLKVPHQGLYSGRAKLSREQVFEIRHKLKEGVKRKDLAEYYQVSENCIRSIHLGISWTDLT